MMENKIQLFETKLAENFPTCKVTSINKGAFIKVSLLQLKGSETKGFQDFLNAFKKEQDVKIILNTKDCKVLDDEGNPTGSTLTEKAPAKKEAPAKKVAKKKAVSKAAPEKDSAPKEETPKEETPKKKAAKKKASKRVLKADRQGYYDVPKGKETIRVDIPETFNHIKKGSKVSFLRSGKEFKGEAGKVFLCPYNRMETVLISTINPATGKKMSVYKVADQVTLVE